MRNEIWSVNILLLIIGNVLLDVYFFSFPSKDFAAFTLIFGKSGINIKFIYIDRNKKCYNIDNSYKQFLQTYQDIEIKKC